MKWWAKARQMMKEAIIHRVPVKKNKWRTSMAINFTLRHLTRATDGSISSITMKST